MEEKSQANKRNASEGICFLFFTVLSVDRKHRIVLPKHEDHSTSKSRDDCCIQCRGGYYLDSSIS